MSDRGTDALSFFPPGWEKTRDRQPSQSRPTVFGITVREPWASLIILGHMPFVNRMVPPGRRVLGRRIVIQASRKDPDAVGLRVMERLGLRVATFPSGRVIGSVVIEGCIDHSPSPFWRGAFGWVVRGPRPYDGPEVKGGQTTWPYEGRF